MAAVATTIALVTESETEGLAGLSRMASNVAVVTAADTDHAEQRMRWQAARSRSGLFTLVDFDPLRPLVEQWLQRLEGDENPLPIPPIDVPDYYFVDVEVEEPLAAWYLQLLFDYAPQRIVSVEISFGSLYRALEHLAYGPSLPAFADLEQATRTFVPTPEFTASHGYRL